MSRSGSAGRTAGHTASTRASVLTGAATRHGEHLEDRPGLPAAQRGEVDAVDPERSEHVHARDGRATAEVWSIGRR